MKIELGDVVIIKETGIRGSINEISNDSYRVISTNLPWSYNRRYMYVEADLELDIVEKRERIQNKIKDLKTKIKNLEDLLRQ